MIAKGSKMVRIDGDHRTSIFEVKAFRRGPVAYVELEPVGGGARIAVLMSDLSRAFRAYPEALST